jgi:hypothetical protein
LWCSFAGGHRRLSQLRRPRLDTGEIGTDDVGLDWLQAKLRSIRTTLWAAEDRVVADNFVTLRDLEHATNDVLEELKFEALRAARLEEFKAQLL